MREMRRLQSQSTLTYWTAPFAPIRCTLQFIKFFFFQYYSLKMYLFYFYRMVCVYAPSISSSFNILTIYTQLCPNLSYYDLWGTELHQQFQIFNGKLHWELHVLLDSITIDTNFVDQFFFIKFGTPSSIFFCFYFLPSITKSKTKQIHILYFLAVSE